MRLSAVVLTKNAEMHVADCLKSLNWADEILVIDCGSSDCTVELAQLAGAKVVYNPWPGFAAQRNFALDLCTNDWVLMIDVDERVSKALAEEIKEVLTREALRDIVGYSIPRQNYFWGRWMRGDYPDRHFNLFRRSAGRFKDIAVHEVVELQGSTIKLKNPLIHYPYKNLAHFVDKMNWYSTLGAQEKIRRGQSFSLLRMFSNPISAFVKMYIIKGGFRDGIPGFVFAVTYSFYTFMKYAKLYLANKT